MYSARSANVGSRYSVRVPLRTASPSTSRSTRGNPWPFSPCAQIRVEGDSRLFKSATRVDERRVDDDVLGRHHVDRMCQRVADEIGVEQRDDRTDARYPKPNRQVLGTVRHHQADDIAGRQTLSMRPTGVAPGPLCQRAVGQDFSRRQQRRRIAKSLLQRIDQQRAEFAWGSERSVRSFRARAPTL